VEAAVIRVGMTDQTCRVYSRDLATLFLRFPSDSGIALVNQLTTLFPSLINENQHLSERFKVFVPFLVLEFNGYQGKMMTPSHMMNDIRSKHVDVVICTVSNEGKLYVAEYSYDIVKYHLRVFKEQRARPVLWLAKFFLVQDEQCSRSC